MNSPKSSADEALGRIWSSRLAGDGDALEQMALLDVEKRLRSGREAHVLDVCFGDGALALRLAKAGAQVLAVDNANDAGKALMSSAKAMDLADRIAYANWAPGRAEVNLPGGPFDLVIVHCSLSYQPYPKAVAMVRELLLNTSIGGRLYISAYGLHSDLGDDYPDADKPVRHRHAELPEALAGRYEIAGPVCLYSERDLFMLLFEAGASVLRTFSTTHGNVKAVGVRV